MQKTKLKEGEWNDVSSHQISSIFLRWNFIIHANWILHVWTLDTVFLKSFSNIHLELSLIKILTSGKLGYRQLELRSEFNVSDQMPATRQNLAVANIISLILTFKLLISLLWISTVRWRCIMKDLALVEIFRRQLCFQSQINVQSKISLFEDQLKQRERILQSNKRHCCRS